MIAIEPTSDLTHACLYFETLYNMGDIVEIRCISHGDNSTRQYWLDGGNPDAVLKALTMPKHLNNNSDYSVYAGVNTRTKEGGAKAEDVKAFRALAADLDGGVSLDEALCRVQQANLPDPSMTVATGGGIQFYWLLSEPSLSPGEWIAGQRHLAEKLQGDTAVCDPPRVLRVPGFVNRKPKRHGYRARLVEAIRDRKYCLSDVVPSEVLIKASNEATAGLIRSGGAEQRGGLPAATILQTTIYEGQRHIFLRDYALQMVFNLIDYESPAAIENTVATLEIINQQKCKPPDDLKSVRRNVVTAVQFRRNREYNGNAREVTDATQLANDYQQYIAANEDQHGTVYPVSETLESHGLIKRPAPEFGYTEWLPGEWKLKIVNSDPAEVELVVPVWADTPCKGVVTMPHEDFLKANLVNEHVFKQTLSVVLAPSPKAWQEIWEGCTRSRCDGTRIKRTFSGLRQKLISQATLVEVSLESKRFAAVAGLLLRHLSRSAEFVEGEEPVLQANGRGTWVDANSLWFRWNEAWEDINRVNRVTDGERRDVARRLRLAVGMSSLVTHRKVIDGHKWMFTVFDRSWLAALEQLACGEAGGTADSGI